jgi:hypothetical protein
MRDTARNPVGVYEASQQYSWRYDVSNEIRGSNHEAAMRQFVMDNESPLAVFDVKRGTNGFDLAYVVRDENGYKLVIVEAKSGAVGKLTDFGEGMRSEAQLVKNLATVRDAVESSSLPTAAKFAVREQLRTRTFETELFMAETSNLKVPQLDFLSGVTGRPVQKVVVLPMKR